MGLQFLVVGFFLFVVVWWMLLVVLVRCCRCCFMLLFDGVVVCRLFGVFCLLFVVVC